MSRIVKAPVALVSGTQAQLNAEEIVIKGSKESLSLRLSPLVQIKQEGDELLFSPANESREALALSGTFRQLVNNMVEGVSKGFEKKLTLVGVGFRAQASGSKLNLSVGFSHPVNIEMPQGVTVETPAPTEVVVKGADRQQVGQMAAEIRAVRPPEPYKGKGIRYTTERIVLKEAKKK